VGHDQAMGFGVLPIEVRDRLNGSLRLRAPCRVVYVVDEPRRRGFAYGTLAGHQESGEEAFMIEHHDDDSVSFKVTAFSRPATRLAKIAGPLGAVVQRRITARYLRSLGKIALQLACRRVTPRRQSGSCPGCPRRRPWHGQRFRGPGPWLPRMS